MNIYKLVLYLILYKMRWKFLLVFGILLAVGLNIGFAFSAEVNVTPVSAVCTSGERAGYPCSSAIDRDYSTYWYSLNYPATVSLDLGKQMSIYGYWAKARTGGKSDWQYGPEIQLRLYSSNDGITYTDMNVDKIVPYDDTCPPYLNRPACNFTKKFTAVNARYIKAEIIGKICPCGYEECHGWYPWSSCDFSLLKNGLYGIEFYCNADSDAVTCAGKCGDVSNNCGKLVDCGDTCPEGTSCSPSNICVTCVNDDDCNHLDSECSYGTCVSGTCTNSFDASGTACNDNSLCTSGDVCDGLGTCSGTLTQCIGQICDPASATCYDKHFCTSSDDTIMKLNMPKNSLGSVYSDTQAEYGICYSDIFPGRDILVDSHICSSENTPLLWLSAARNANASSAIDANHQLNVCYGDLKCEYDESPGETCATPGNRVVLKLESSSDSLMSNASDSVFTKKICCNNDAVVNGIYWENMNGVKVSSADLKDRVALTIEGNNLDKIPVDIKIYKDNNELWNNVFIEKESPKKIIATWKAGNKTDGNYYSGDYYFNVTINGITYDSRNTPASNIYGMLSVSASENNAPPVAVITKPITGSIFSKNINIDFQQASYDVDDYIYYTWNFGSVLKSGSTRNYLDYNTTYSYSDIGQKNILLNISDERGIKRYNSTSILIVDYSVDKNYVFAGIKRPYISEVVPQTFEYDGSNSYAIQVSSVPLLVTCLGGLCPLTTDSGNSIADPGSLRGFYNMFNFTWIFDDSEKKTSTTSQKVNKNYATERDNAWVNLTTALKITSEKDSTITRFKVGAGSSLNYCSFDKRTWYENLMSYSTLSENGKCRGEDGNALTADDCCPADFKCMPNSSNPSLDKYSCQADVSQASCVDRGILFCTDYKDSVNCSADDCNVRGNGGNCGITTGNVPDVCNLVSPNANCRCHWNTKGTADTSDDACEQRIGIAATLYNQINLGGECIMDGITSGTCVEGVMNVNEQNHMEWDAGGLTALSNYLNNLGDPLSGNPEQWLENNCDLSICSSGEKNVVCGSGSAMLGFFNWISFFIALIAIIGIYFIIALTKKRRA